MTTATIAPPKAATGTSPPDPRAWPYAMTIVAPSPLGDRLGEQDEARAPPRRDAVVDDDDALVRDCGDVAPPRPRCDRRRALPATHRVGEHDHLRVRRDDVLGRELRIAGVRRVC